MDLYKTRHLPIAGNVLFFYNMPKRNDKARQQDKSEVQYVLRQYNTTSPTKTDCRHASLKVY